MKLGQKHIPLSLLFVLVAIFLSPIEVIDLNPVKTEAEVGRQRSVNIGPPDFVFFLALLSFMAEGRRVRFIRAIPVAWYAAFLLLGLASTLRASVPLESIKHLVQYAFILLGVIPVIGAVLKTEERVRWSGMALALGLAANLTLAVWVLLTLGRVGESGYGEELGAAEFYGAGGLSRAAMVAVPLFLALLRRQLVHGLGTGTFLLGGLWILAFVMGMLAFNRSAMVAIVTGLVVVLVLPITGKVRASRVALRVCVLAILTVVFAWKGYELVVPETYREVYAAVAESPLEDVSVRARYETNMAVLRSWQETLILGWGYDVPNIVAKIDRYITGPTINPLPHNVFLNWWAEAGLLGMVIMITATCKCVMAGWRGLVASGSSSWTRGLLVGLVGAYLSILFHYVFHASVFRRMDWVIVGLILAASSPRGRPLGLSSQSDGNRRVTDHDTKPHEKL